jgi:1,4-dihydroxy-2-naphthoyl-CoA hydrolase
LAESGFAAAVPLAGLLGIEIVAAELEEVRGTLPWRDDLCTSSGILHGGALMAFADTLGGVCAFLHLPEGAGTATVESKTNFFRPVRDGVVTGVARPLHVGRTFIVVQTDLTDGDDRRVAQVTQTQAVLARKAR